MSAWAPSNGLGLRCKVAAGRMQQRLRAAAGTMLDYAFPGARLSAADTAPTKTAPALFKALLATTESDERSRQLHGEAGG